MLFIMDTLWITLYW